MARRSTAIVRAVSTTPTIRIATPRSAPIVKRRTRSRSRRSGGGGGGMSITEAALTGAGVGIIVRSDFASNIPTIGPLGKIGTIGLGLHMLGGGNKWAKRGALACAIIAGFQYMKDGSVSGDEDI